MRKFFAGFLVIMLALVAVYAVLGLQRLEGESLGDYRNLEKRLQVIIGIRAPLTSLTDSIWRAISAYDPKSGKKVGFSNNMFNDSFDRWNAEVEQVKKETPNDEARRKLDILQRSLRVLARRVYSLDDDSINKIMSDDIFSDEVETKSKDVYTDLMQKTMGQIRVSVGVVNTAISEYVEAAVPELVACNRVAEGTSAKVDRMVQYFLGIGAVLLLFSLVGIGRIKPKSGGL
jgi:hypothetical protein